MPSEGAVGITAFSTPGPGFLATTKQRYSDFIVREVDPVSGLPVRLTALPEAPKAPSTDASKDDASTIEADLAAVIGEEHAKSVMALLQGAATSGGGASEVVLPRDDDKEQRTRVHRLFKQPALQGLVTDTIDTECGGKSIRVQTKKAARNSGGGGGSNKRKRIDNRNEWPPEAGDKAYLGFTLYKENRETVEALSKLARGLGVGPNLFQLAGTKDKRGITTQRVNAYKLAPEKLCKLMASRPFGDSIVVGDLRFESTALRLGAHGGNRFTIVLRDISCSEAQLEAALSALQRVGFVNYFGLQRFGATDAAATHKLGVALLRSDFQSAIEMILGASRGNEWAEETAARELWKSSKDAAAVLAILPRRMGIERQLLEGVVRHGATNPLGALSRLPRSLRSMYLHAFQSYVFNHAASERVRLYGCDKAVAGDLVWPGGVAPSFGAAGKARGEGGVAAGDGGGSELDGGGEGGDLAGCEDGEGDAFVAEGAESGGGDFVPHVVSAEEAAAGTYSIEDVLLPLPGFTTRVPENDVKDEYARVMAEENLDESMLKHRVRELALPGSYRKLIQKPDQMTWRVLRYDDPQLPLAPTDLGILRGEPEPEGVAGGERMAARLEFTLPASTYATMCLRELTKQSTDLAHQNKLNERSVAPPPPPTDSTNASEPV